jgi:hypothetical protein
MKPLITILTLLIAGTATLSTARADEGVLPDLPRWNAAGADWTRWDWNSGNAWNTGSELNVLPSPEGRLAATLQWENERMRVEIWDTASQELLATVDSPKEFKSWMTRNWSWQSKQWKSWSTKVTNIAW